ncbi:MAG: protein phosphatase 2C domain-containing protein [Thermoguttaceae bacterium]
MRFDSRTFMLPKDPEHPGQCQDACQVDAARGIAVIADGVSSAIFSAQWANVLVEAVMAAAPDPNNAASFAAWLARQRQTWTQRIDSSTLAWHQRAKLPMGAFSTLLWIQVTESEREQPGAFGAYRLRGFAIGDSCLFHVRGRELVRSFPLETAAQFQADPIVLGSIDLKRDYLMRFTMLNELCYPDDLLILCTDALAEWALKLHEAGGTPDWDRCRTMSEADWQAQITELRRLRHIRYDDTTLVLLRVLAPTPGATGGEPSGARGEWNVEELSKKAKAVSGQVVDQIDQVSERVARGFLKFKDKALKKYRDKFGPDKKK